MLPTVTDASGFLATGVNTSSAVKLLNWTDMPKSTPTSVNGSVLGKDFAPYIFITDWCVGRLASASLKPCHLPAAPNGQRDCSAARGGS